MAVWDIGGEGQWDLRKQNMVYGPWWWRGSMLQGSGDGRVTSCLCEEKVVATRQRCGALSEVGLGGSDTGKERTGHGRRREGWWQRWQKDALVAVGGVG